MRITLELIIEIDRVRKRGELDPIRQCSPKLRASYDPMKNVKENDQCGGMSTKM